MRFWVPQRAQCRRRLGGWIDTTRPTSLRRFKARRRLQHEGGARRGRLTACAHPTVIETLAGAPRHASAARSSSRVRLLPACLQRTARALSRADVILRPCSIDAGPNACRPISSSQTGRGRRRAISPAPMTSSAPCREAHHVERRVRRHYRKLLAVLEARPDSASGRGIVLR